ncbi:EF-hand domain-containing protein [Cerasicoccus frondis]|uniref:EF-hand domain-containing protein n=1 Tax=Cerasicoccus frondis TaxID=490090 RepID=UPI002852AE71|nr:EF-hand domain-containing protein [Cerasicoccus frondis]
MHRSQNILLPRFCLALVLGLLINNVQAEIILEPASSEESATPPRPHDAKSGERPPRPEDFAAGERPPLPGDAGGEDRDAPGPYGPLSAADANRDGTVTWKEWETFADASPYRRHGKVAYFDSLDANHDGVLSEAEQKQAAPKVFDGFPRNAAGEISRADVVRFESSRIYRSVGLEEFFKMVDTNGDKQLSPEEIKAAKENGLLDDQSRKGDGPPPPRPN